MLLALINNHILDRLVAAFAHTLMHSLWQGILLAAAAGLIVICTRGASSALRYNLLITALMLFATGFAVTLGWQYQRLGGRPVIDYAVQGSSYHMGSPQDVNQLSEEAPTPFTGLVYGFLNDHHTSIVLVWFLIICARSLQLGVGLYGTCRLRRVRVSAVPDPWGGRVRQLADTLNIKQAVELLESGLVKAPIMIGHLKPLILVPVGLLAALSPAEVEAILIHELAHIKRRDYLVNLVQSLMEIVFFFNPAVLWVSKLIRNERENCCDDLALAQSNNKVAYIRALVSCEEYQSAVPFYAIGFSGENTLLQRVKRMTSSRNYSLNLFEKTVLAVCLVAFGIGVSAFTAREHIKKALTSVAAVIHHDARSEQKAKIKAVKTDITVGKKSASVDDGTALLNQSRRAALPAADTDKPPARANSPLPLRAKADTNKPALETSHAIARELYREQLLVDTNHLSISLDDHELIVNGVIMPQDVYERIYRQFGSGQYWRSGNYGGSLAQPYENKHPGPYDAFLKQRSEAIAEELVRDNLVSDNNHFTYKLSRDELFIDGVRQSEELHRRIIDKYFKPDDYYNLNYIRRDPGSYAHDDLKSYLSDAYQHHNSAADYETIGQELKRSQAEIDKKLVADLLQDGLITDPKNVSFSLNDKELTINGKRQSDEIYRKYKEKYAPGNTGSGWNWTYSHHE